MDRVEDEKGFGERGRFGVLAVGDGQGDESSEDDESDEDMNPPEPARVPQSETPQGAEELIGEHETVPMRATRNPVDPTPEEREEHWKTHLPYRAWCPVCVKARGREDPHKAKTKGKDELPVIAMDYCDIGDRKLLVGRVDDSGFTFSHLATCKGTNDEKIVGKVLRSINESGNTKIVLKTDGEPAIIQVQEKVVAERSHPTVPRNPPAYDPQANGVAERAVQEVKCQLRAIKLGLEARLEKEIDNKQAILEWMIPHAADSINKYLVGEDGRTAYYRVNHKNFNGKVFEFGEQVLAKPKRSNKAIKKKQALDARFLDATWVGFDTRSAEHMVVLKDKGPAIKVRTVKPRAASERWSSSAIEDIIATPDAPNPKDETQQELKSERNTKGLNFGADKGHELPRQKMKYPEGITRNFRIGDRLLEKYGFTEGCLGCEAKQKGDPPHVHSDACRSRLEKAMMEDEREAKVISGRNERKGVPKTEERREEPPPPPTEEPDPAPGASSSSGTTAPPTAAAPPEPREESKRRGEDEDGGDQVGKRRRMAQLSRAEVLRASTGQVLQECLPTSAQGAERKIMSMTTEMLIDELDQAWTRKERRRHRRDQRQAGEDKTCTIGGVASDLGYEADVILDTEASVGTGVMDWIDADKQARLESTIKEKSPWLIKIMLNFVKHRTEDSIVGIARETVREGAALDFVMDVCQRQAAKGNKFVVEWLDHKGAHATRRLNQLYQIEDVQRIKVKDGAFVMTNSRSSAKALRDPTEGRLKRVCLAAVDEYKERKGRRSAWTGSAAKQDPVILLFSELMRGDEAMVAKVNSAIIAAMNQDNAIYNEYEFFDDVTGKELNKGMAIAARKLEMKFFRDMKVYEKVPREHAKRDGCKVISTRWLDIDKGDAKAPNYRSRLVGREIKTDSRLDLFAATPPLESLRLICSICASHQHGRNPYRIMAVDVKRAYFYAKTQRPVYIEIPIEDFEDGDEARVARLNLSLYGTRDAAQNWAKEYTGFLVGCGFKCGRASPCNFHHEARQLSATVHGDDFTVTGPEASLGWLRMAMTARYDIKSKMLGPGNDMEQEIQVLNRTIAWTPEGITYEADQRHAEIVISEMGLKKGKPVATPSVPEAAGHQEERDRSPVLKGEDASRYRALAARINYLSLDRADLQYTAKTVSRYMANPRELDWVAIKRVARYLIGATRAVQVYRWQQGPGDIDTYVDSDWAGDRASRKSTSGGVMKWGQHVIKTWSSTQHVIALSSGEAELYALTRGATMAKGLMSMLNDFHLNAQATIYSDASAAIGISHRRGLGKTRHIEVQELWIQDEIARKALKVTKVSTHHNPADIMTKAVNQELMTRHAKSMDLYIDSSRAASALELHGVSMRPHSSPRSAERGCKDMTPCPAKLSVITNNGGFG